MSCRVLFQPTRAMLVPRPAIQAWRNDRFYATEITTESTADSALPPIPTSLNTPQSSNVDAVKSSIPTPSPQDAQLPVTSEGGASGISETAVVETKEKGQRKPVGVVVSAGKMQNTVKVRIPGQTFNKHLRKLFKTHSNHLVHDPNSSLRIGDVVSLQSFRAAKHVHHVVSEILVPFGPPIGERPPVPTEQERLDQYNIKRAEKLERRKLRREAAQGVQEAIDTLRVMGLDPGQGAEAGVGKKTELKKGLVGRKGQKLPEGVLPGGMHAVGKIQTRASGNKTKVERRNEQAADNLIRVKEVAGETGH